MRNRKYPLTRVGRPSLHGAYSWLRSGYIPKEKAYLERWADSITCEFIEDLGGKENVSTGQLLLLKQIKTLIVYQTLIEEYVVNIGLLNGKGEVPPCLQNFYGSATNQITRNIALLGLKRQSKEMDLQTYIRQNYPEPDTSKPATASQDAPGATIGSGHREMDGKKDVSDGK